MEVLINKELRASFQEKVLGPMYAVGGAGYYQAVGHLLDDASNLGMVLGLILERIMGDEMLESRWNELPDLLVDLILDGLGVPHHDDNYTS